MGVYLHPYPATTHTAMPPWYVLHDIQRTTWTCQLLPVYLAMASQLALKPDAESSILQRPGTCSEPNK